MQRPPQNEFDKLPDELLLEIFSYLNPEFLENFSCTNPKAHDTTSGLIERINLLADDQLFWRKKLALHFPYVFSKLASNKNEINWHAFFKKTYNEEYKGLSLAFKKIFSLVKEGHIQALKTNSLGLADFAGKDSQDLTIIDWAKKKNDQACLDYFYQIVVKKYSVNTINVDVSKKINNKTLLYWAIFCHQSVDTIKLLILAGASRDEVLTTNMNALRLAAEEGLASHVEYLLKNNSPIDGQTDLGATALLLAIENGHKNVVDILLKYDANVSLPLLSDGSSHTKFGIKAGDTPLHAAIKLRRKDIVEALIAKGADIHGTSTTTHLNALRLAAQWGEPNIVKSLIKHGCDVNDRSATGTTALLLATQNDQKEIVDILLENDADVSLALQEENNYHKQFQTVVGDTPLHVAIKLGKNNILKSLLSKIENIDAIISGHSSALLLAVAKGQAEVVETLIQHGQDVNACNPIGFSALVLAIEGKDKTIVDLLLKHQVNVNIPLVIVQNNYDLETVTGDTPLHTAIKSGKKEIVEALLDHGADINALCARGTSPLGVAAKRGEVEIVELLLNRGCDINTRTLLGATPLLLAIEANKPEVVNVLLKRRADVTLALTTNKSDSVHHDLHIFAGDTPLHAAAALGYEKMVHALLQNNADMTALNAKGETPLQVAKKNSSCVLELELAATTNTINRYPDNYHKTFSIFGWKFNMGCSGRELKEGAQVLKNVFFEGGDKSKLPRHHAAWKSDELKPIYNSLLSRK